jgi:hypothetical protein
VPRCGMSDSRTRTREEKCGSCGRGSGKSPHPLIGGISARGSNLYGGVSLALARGR